MGKFLRILQFGLGVNLRFGENGKSDLRKILTITFDEFEEVCVS